VIVEAEDAPRKGVELLHSPCTFSPPALPRISASPRTRRFAGDDPESVGAPDRKEDLSVPVASGEIAVAPGCSDISKTIHICEHCVWIV
jgi:hypothetical protein